MFCLLNFHAFRCYASELATRIIAIVLHSSVSSRFMMINWAIRLVSLKSINLHLSANSTLETTERAFRVALGSRLKPFEPKATRLFSDAIAPVDRLKSWICRTHQCSVNAPETLKFFFLLCFISFYCGQSSENFSALKSRIFGLCPMWPMVVILFGDISGFWVLPNGTQCSLRISNYPILKPDSWSKNPMAGSSLEKFASPLLRSPGPAWMCAVRLRNCTHLYPDS